MDEYNIKEDINIIDSQVRELNSSDTLSAASVIAELLKAKAALIASVTGLKAIKYSEEAWAKLEDEDK